jgi:ankyrin repeat protein
LLDSVIFLDNKYKPEENMKKLQEKPEEKSTLESSTAPTSDLSTISLHIAARDGNVVLINLLLIAQGGFNQQDLKDSNGLAPLHHAAINGQVEAMKALLTAKADPNVDNGLGYTPLFCLAFCFGAKGKKEALQKQTAGVKLLLESKASVYARPADKLPTHYYFALQGNKTTTRLLLNSGARNIEDSHLKEFPLAARRVGKYSQS